MIITLAGAPASGKGTVGDILAKRLGFKKYSTGQMRRDEAQRRGMTLEQFNEWSLQNEIGDKYFDDLQKNMGEHDDNFIIDGRLAWYFIPHSIKVYLDVDIDEATRRRFAEINRPGRAEAQLSTIDDVKKTLVDRTAHDLTRYGKIYGITKYDINDFDIAIDTTNLKPEEVADVILSAIQKMGVKLPSAIKN